MGLSGRKTKQRIGKDPRNLSWADDASRFGQAYLAKFGWDGSKGLGVSGEGRTSAIKATQKLDMLGIGMRHQGDLEGGIAWRQNRDFEDLLRRLNDGTTTETADSTELLGSFHKAREPKSEALEDGSGGDGDGVVDKVKDDGSNSDGDEEREAARANKEKKKKKKKRKVAAEEDEVEEREGLDRKERRKRRKKSSSRDDDDDGRAPVPSSIESAPPLLRSSSREAPLAEESGSVPMDAATAIATAARPTAVTAPVPVRAPPRTHRARIIAAKRMAASNSTALAEILGIPSSSSSSARPSAVASPLPGPALSFATTTTTTPSSTPSNATATPEAKDLLQSLTTSSQSVGDYFRAKLSAKANGERLARPTSAAASVSTQDDDDGGRIGLGLGGRHSRIPPIDGLGEEPVRGGIGASSLSMFATMFMPHQPTTNAQEENTATAGVETVVSHDASDYDDNPQKREKMRAKEERRRKKEERRRKREEARQVDCVMQAADVPVEGAPAAKSKKKHREPEAPNGQLEDSHPHPSGAEAMEAIGTKKRKKDKKSSKHRGREE